MLLVFDFICVYDFYEVECHVQEHQVLPAGIRQGVVVCLTQGAVFALALLKS